MRTKTIHVLMGFLMTPGIACAATDCRVVEFADHFEVVCAGDEKSVPATVAPVVAPAPAPKTEQAAKLAPAPAAPSAPPATGGAKPTSDAVKKLIDYRQHRLQRTDVETKKAVRMSNMVSGQQQTGGDPRSENSATPPMDMTPPPDLQGMTEESP